MPYELIDESPARYTLIEEGGAPPATPFDIHPSVASAANIINSALFGFGDELYGRIAPGDYATNRDRMRETIKQFRSGYPAAAVIGDVSGGLAYGGPLSRVAAIAAPTSLLGKTGLAASVGGAYGALQGAGDAPEMSEIPASAARGGIAGAAISGAMQPTAAMIGAIGKNIGARFINRQADDIARRRIADALARDDMTIPRVEARAAKMGQQATIADAGGENTRGLLDTVATLPGKTRNKLEQLIHDRQAERSGRLVDAAGAAMGIGGVRLNDAKAAFVAKAEGASKPLYDQLRDKQFMVDQSLEEILKRSQGALGEARKLAQVEGTLKTFPSGDPETWKVVDFNTLNTLKQSLYDMAESTRNIDTGKLSGYGVALNKLRHELTNHMDDATGGLYKQARDAFAGPMQMDNAASLGYKAMTQDAWKVAEITKGMSSSEREAFNIGALEALRKRLGTESGQTSVLKMWKEPTTRERLQEIFPSVRSYREFASVVAGQARMKPIERIGRGSQTAPRLAGIDDLTGAVMRDTVDMATAAKTSNPLGVWAAAKDIWGKASTPPAVRDAIGGLLLSKPTDIRYKDLQQIQTIMEMQAQRDAARGVASGISGGLLGGMF